VTEVTNPSQTIGPLYGFALMFDGSDHAVPADAPGAVRVEGRVIDGDGDPVAFPDCMVEVWHSDQWTRTRTDEAGTYRVVVTKPAPRRLPDGRVEAPHLNLTVFARGLLKQAQTRLYFPDEPDANAQDPVLAAVPEQDRHTLLAREEGDRLVLDVYLQGPRETVFFDF
jgi:protocatechuate 3,4-dioxygenase, alpha subunit